jgi:hypothetical protein
VEHFEDDDDNNNDADDVEDVSVHGSWGNTSLSPAASNIIVARDCGLPLHPAVPRVILNDLGERIGDLAGKEPFPPFFVASYARPAQPKHSQNQRFGTQIEIKENKTPGGEH